MTPLDIAAILAAGLVAGMANAIVGSGSLVTFPVLLAVGYTPVVANVTNTVGIVFGSISGVVGYRRELVGQRDRITALALPSAAGSLAGALLLLVLPEAVFHRVVPLLILFALALVIAQPRLSALLANHRDHPFNAWALRVAVFLTAIYGGYFGAAQGVILVSLMGVLLHDSLQRINALKNVVAAIVNAVSAVVFVFLAHIAWPAVLLLAVSSTGGGQLGSAVGRRLAPNLLRALIVVAGVAAVVRLLL
ncbi:MAG: sulfite exporter TauE/SafE family protein [Candidatus Dormibacteraceae bacterium]